MTKHSFFPGERVAFPEYMDPFDRTIAIELRKSENTVWLLHENGMPRSFIAWKAWVKEDWIERLVARRKKEIQYRDKKNPPRPKTEKCEACGEVMKNPSQHHDSYIEEGKIRWLCHKSCHHKADGERKFRLYRMWREDATREEIKRWGSQHYEKLLKQELET